MIIQITFMLFKVTFNFYIIKGKASNFQNKPLRLVLPFLRNFKVRLI